jgi:hypothetical protein
MKHYRKNKARQAGDDPDDREDELGGTDCKFLIE